MSTSDQGGDSVGAESGRELARPHEDAQPARPRPTARVIARRVVREAAREVAGAIVEAAVGAWAPEWAEAARVLVVAAQAAGGFRRGRGRGGRPRA
ncbi:hypothetical protein NJL88_27680 [Streptomyces sp. DK15]|uniref:hypothetical protein n=1 Tax=Streptomyces sp. DK15 TaxID=2957499 RepID=UPI0029A1D049|nr:hypothetical protein [Streptomyces sp. DK15]MDX2393774.1 hypothetical protein [Streptomyces sp. DK15]